MTLNSSCTPVTVRSSLLEVFPVYRVLVGNKFIGSCRCVTGHLCCWSYSHCLISFPYWSTETCSFYMSTNALDQTLLISAWMIFFIIEYDYYSYSGNNSMRILREIKILKLMQKLEKIMKIYFLFLIVFSRVSVFWVLFWILY